MKNTETKLEVGMLLYPGFTLLDLAGPLTVLSVHSKIELFSKSLDPVYSDSGTAILPTRTFGEVPARLDILFVPGGFGTADAMRNPEIIEFLKTCAPRAAYVTSVCTGSLILAAAGLLDGYKATSHWAMRDQLVPFGAQPAEGRVVVDRNRATGGGVTAGIDFGLTLLAKLRGRDAAEMIQLALEYDPLPPFDSGSPDKAAPATVDKVRAWITGMEQSAP